MIRLAVLRVLVAVAVAAAGLVTTEAVASQTDAGDAQEQGSVEAQRRGEEALASLKYPWRDLGYSIEFRDHQGRTLGTANSRTKRIVIYVKRDHTHSALRVTIAHELGHALDFEHATTARRHDYRDIRELSQEARWYPCSGCTDYRSHAGDWAEVFAFWLAGPDDFRSEVAGPPSPEQLRRLGPLFQIPKAQAASSPSPAASPTPAPRPTLLPGTAAPTLPATAASAG